MTQSGPVIRQQVRVDDSGSPAVVTTELGPLHEGLIRVDVMYVGVCHSDIAAVSGGYLKPGEGIGHEVAGIVSESTDPEYRPGDRVIVYGTGEAYSSQLDVPARYLVRVHDNCSMIDAALAEPVACVIGGVEMIDFTNCSEVVLVGAGFMGLIALRYLALLGHRVTVVEPSADRRQRALQLGASRVIEPGESDRLKPEGYPVVIEATGVAPGLHTASDLVAIDGVLGLLGYHQSDGGRREVPMERWNFRAITVRSLHHRNFDRMIRWVDRAQRAAAVGALCGSDLVEAEIGFEEVCRVLQSDRSSNATGAIKAVLVPGRSLGG